MHCKWEPSYEPANWVDVDAAITSWKNQSKKNETCIVDGIGMEREISIPKVQVHHLIQHMAHQIDAIDDEELKNDVHNIYSIVIVIRRIVFIVKTLVLFLVVI